MWHVFYRSDEARLMPTMSPYFQVNGCITYPSGHQHKSVHEIAREVQTGLLERSFEIATAVKWPFQRLPSVLQFDQSPLDSQSYGFCAVASTKFAQNRTDVKLDGTLGNDEFSRDFFIL